MDQQRFELLKTHYQNLHTSYWEAHKITWTVTGIFIPAVFALQRYLIKGADGKKQVIAAVIIVEALVVFWRLIVRCFVRYNRVRLDRLRVIEGIFNGEFGKDWIKQYLDRRYKLRISPNPLYDSIVVLFTGLNTQLLFGALETIIAVCLTTILFVIYEILSKKRWNKLRSASRTGAA